MSHHIPPPAGTLVPCSGVLTAAPRYVAFTDVCRYCSGAILPRGYVAVCCELLDTNTPLLAEPQVPPLPATRYRVIRI